MGPPGTFRGARRLRCPGRAGPFFRFQFTPPTHPSSFRKIWEDTQEPFKVGGAIKPLYAVPGAVPGRNGFLNFVHSAVLNPIYGAS